jgi:pimeloyl-ACP methyl ester carboxylesterase
MPTINPLIKKWYGSPFPLGGNDMPTATPASGTITARTQFVRAKNETYAYRRFGHGPGGPLLCLQHFMGTLDNWDPAVTDALASGREVILFDNEHLPNAVLLTYPDSGHGSLFQFHESFTRQAAAFLASDSPFAPY